MSTTGLNIIIRNIHEDISTELNRIGIHCRIHARIKDNDSLEEKIENRGKGYYSETGRKIQDLIGFRITTYFIEDVKLLWDLFSKKYDIAGESYDEITEANIESFRPMRKNLICRFTVQNTQIFDELRNRSQILNLVENTFEIQFRTTLSEGWHEVDHVLRYKCKDDWTNLLVESRMLNGIYASLETSDQALKGLFDDLSYHHYKNKNWEAMLRTKYRLKFEKRPLSEELCGIFNKSPVLAKEIFRFERKKIIEKIAYSKLHIPITFDNLVFVINFLRLNNSDLNDLTPSIIKLDFDNYLQADTTR